MQDEKYDVGNGSGMKFKEGKKSAKLENFFYYYKWHVIIAIFIVAVVVICSFQMCSKTDYDIHIIYAGSYDVRGSKNENDISPYDTVRKSISEAVEDFDGNGEVFTSFEAMYMLSAKEIEELERELAELEAKGEASMELNYTLLNENNAAFRDRLTYSDYYLYIISESLYETYKMSGENYVFESLTEYTKENPDIKLLDGRAIYLSSTEWGKLPGLSDMPEDTVIALRTRGAFASHFDSKGNEENYQNDLKVIKNIIEYEN